MAANVFTVSLVGDKELQRALKGIEPKLGKKAIRKAVREGAKIWLRQAKANAPILTDMSNVTKTTQMPVPGTLRKGITLKTGHPDGKRKKNRYAIQVKLKPRNKMKDLNIASGDGSYAPISIEYGWTTKSGTKVPGVFYIHNAFFAKLAAVEKKTIVGIRKGLFNIWNNDTRRPR